MPVHKLKPQRLQCPFCPVISTRGTGLVAHVRAKHPRDYGKWNRNPNRLVEADAAALPKPQARKNGRLHPVRSFSPKAVPEAEAQLPAAQEQQSLPTPPARATDEKHAPEALSLLQEAYDQLSTRKQWIENELARIEGLQSEHEGLTAQVAALDQAMKAFNRLPLRQPRTA